MKGKVNLERDGSLSPSHLIAHQATQGPGALFADPPGDAAGPDLPGLGDHNVAVGRALDGTVQDVLRELRALAAPRGPVYNHHRVTLYQRNDLELKKKKSKLPRI